MARDARSSALRLLWVTALFLHPSVGQSPSPPPLPSLCTPGDASSALQAALTDYDEYNKGCVNGFEKCLTNASVISEDCKGVCVARLQELLTVCAADGWDYCAFRGEQKAPGDVLPAFEVEMAACVPVACGSAPSGLLDYWRGQLCGPAWNTTECAAITATCVGVDTGGDSHVWVIVGSIAAGVGSCLACVAVAWCYQRAKEDADAEEEEWAQLDEGEPELGDSEDVGWSSRGGTQPDAEGEPDAGDDPLVPAQLPYTVATRSSSSNVGNNAGEPSAEVPLVQR